MKRTFKMKEKAFFIIFERLSLKQIIKIFLEGESPTLNMSAEIDLKLRCTVNAVLRVFCILLEH